MTATELPGRVDLSEHGIRALGVVYRNPTTSLLYTHSLTGVSDPGNHTHALSGNTDSGGAHTHTLTITNAGGGGAHNNVPGAVLGTWYITL